MLIPIPKRDISDEVVEALEKMGTKQCIDLLLRSTQTKNINEYLARTLTIGVLGDWAGSFKKYYVCPNCERPIGFVPTGEPMRLGGHMVHLCAKCRKQLERALLGLVK